MSGDCRFESYRDSFMKELVILRREVHAKTTKMTLIVTADRSLVTEMNIQSGSAPSEFHA